MSSHPDSIPAQASASSDIEARLRESEQRLDLAQRAGHVGVFDWSIPDNRIFATAEAEAIYGLPLGKNHYTFDFFLSLLHPEDRPRLQAEVAAALEARLPEMTAEFRIIRPDGTLRYLDQRAIISYDPAGRPLRMVGTTHDITERKIAEEILRASEDKFSRIFALCPDAISLTRIEDGVFIDINAGFERGTGWTRAELIGRSSNSDGAANWVRDADRQHLINMVRQHGEMIDFETQFRTKTGAVITGLISARVIEIGGTRCLLSITRDISERKRAEIQLEQQNAVLSALINSTEDPIFSVDRDYCYTLFNNVHARTIKAIFGRDIRLGGSSIDYLPAPEARQLAQSNLDRALQGQRVDFDFPGPNEKGERRDFFVTLNPVRTPGGEITGVAVFGHDLTDQRRLQSQLLQAQKMEAIGLLAGGIAHDFRNQLTVISAAGDLLHDDPNLPPHLRMLVDQILDAARQSSDMTSKLLSFSRKQMLQPKLVDIAELAAESANILPRLLRHDIRFEFSAESRPLMALLDPIQFQQALFNLATNARDAMPNGGILRIICRRFKPDASFRQRHSDASSSYVAVVVSDTGQGMDPETLAHIFEPFFTTKPVGRGTGLGLAMVYGFVTQCAGIVDVQSSPGSGATFTLLFHEAANHRPVAPAPPQVEGPARSSPQRILIAEDDAAIRHLLVRFLSAAGYEPVECARAPDALGLLQNTAQSFDLLLSDIVMPELSGTDLARHARQLRPELPILLISGFSHSHPHHNTLSGLAAHFLPKPFTRKDLLHAVRHALQPAVAS